jgi:hypothetical protein
MPRPDQPDEQQPLVQEQRKIMAKTTVNVNENTPNEVQLAQVRLRRVAAGVELRMKFDKDFAGRFANLTTAQLSSLGLTNATTEKLFYSENVNFWQLHTYATELKQGVAESTPGFGADGAKTVVLPVIYQKRQLEAWVNGIYAGLRKVWDELLAPVTLELEFVGRRALEV